MKNKYGMCKERKNVSAEMITELRRQQWPERQTPPCYWQSAGQSCCWEHHEPAPAELLQSLLRCFCRYDGSEYSTYMTTNSTHQTITILCTPGALPREQQLSPHWRSLDIWRPNCVADRQRIWGPFIILVIRRHWSNSYPTRRRCRWNFV